jgi:hypothetical protein
MKNKFLETLLTDYITKIENLKNFKVLSCYSTFLNNTVVYKVTIEETENINEQQILYIESIDLMSFMYNNIKKSD